MDSNTSVPEAVRLVLNPEKEKMSVFGAKLVNLYVPTGFPQIVGETVEFLRKVGLHYAAITEGFSASLVEQSDKVWDIPCEVFVGSDDAVWVHFNEDDEQQAYLGTAQEFAERVRQAQTEATPSSAPKMGV